MTFADAVAVRSQTPGVYVADVPAGWDIAGATNGGYLTALVTQAVLAETEALDPVTVTVHFFRAVPPGPVRIEVSPLRRGRRLSTATAVLSDADGELLLAALATVGALPGDGGARAEPDLELIDASAPDLDPPESCILVEPTTTFPHRSWRTSGCASLRTSPGSPAGSPVVERR